MTLRSIIITVCCCFALPACARGDWYSPPIVEFKEHHPMSNYIAMCRRCKVEPERGLSPGHQYDLRNERFGLYVPDVNDVNEPFGLLAWITMGAPNIPEGYTEIFDKYRIISVGVDDSGNARKSTYGRRMPLALDGVHNVMKMYNVDPNRVYITGISAGGRVSSVACMHYPDIFKGGIFIIGANCWEPVRNPTKRRKYWPATFHKPFGKYWNMARHHGRYVMLTGTKDFNRLEMHTYYHRIYKRALKNVIYLEVPGMGHGIPPADWFERAIEYIDMPFKNN